VFKLFKSNPTEDIAHILYSAIVRQARSPHFYSELGVPDTVDGRFDMIVLHAHILFNRLKDGKGDDQAISQAVFDLMFADMDQNLREMGVGDVGVSHRIKSMAEAFYGRATAYADGLRHPDDSLLMGALKRNLYRKCEPAEAQIAAMADYVRQQVAHFETQDLATLNKGEVAFRAAPIPGAS